jgi:hypothetical protein
MVKTTSLKTVNIDASSKLASTVRVRRQKTKPAMNRDLQQGAAKRSAAPAETVTQGKSSGGFVVFSSPIVPKHVSADRILAAVRAVKAR